MDIPFKTRMKFLLEDKIGGKKYSKEDYNNGFEPSFECDVEYDFQERGRHYVLIMKFNKIPNGFLCVEDNSYNCISSPDTEVIMMVIGGVLSLNSSVS